MVLHEPLLCSFSIPDSKDVHVGKPDILKGTGGTSHGTSGVVIVIKKNYFRIPPDIPELFCVRNIIMNVIPVLGPLSLRNRSSRINYFTGNRIGDIVQGQLYG